VPKQIAVEPAIHFGKPCVAGTRIPVQSVLELVSAGITSESIISDYYPELSLADVHACIEYAMTGGLMEGMWPSK
jgi:uncharacterized protein (DUF433 family)